MSGETFTADILSPNSAPALSATSDMPVIAAEPPPAVAATEPPTNAQENPPEGGETAAETPAAEGAAGEAGAENEGGEADPPVDPAGTARPKPKPGPKQPGINERFSTVTEARKAAEARADRLERLLEEAVARIPKEPKQEAQPLPQPEPIVPPEPEPRPVRETFDTPEAYDEALIEWSTKRTLAVERAEREQHDRSTREAQDRDAAHRAEQDNLTTLQATFAERRTAAIEEMPDYAEVAEADGLKISLPMAMAIMQSEDGPKAAYHLGKNPDLAEKISAMVVPGQVFPADHPLAGQPVPDVQRQLIELGKVFAAVATPVAPPVPPPPPVPAPINPLRRGSNAAVNRSLSDVGNEGSAEEYAAMRAEGDDPIARATAARLNFGQSRH